MDPPKPLEEMSSLSIERLLSMLQSNQADVVTEVLTLIRKEFSKVKDRWLINGLIDYFLYSSSQRLLDLIISAEGRHSKYLMENIVDGLRHKEKFRYSTLLLYSVSQKSLPVWVYKIPDHAITKELLLCIDPYREADPSVLVSALMVFVILLPAMPQAFIPHLSKLLESFGLLLHHPPPKTEMKYYLQIAICCFFQRLYGLYPTKLLVFLRHQHSVKPSNLGWYEKTLFPMLEKVRFHPLLVTEQKEHHGCNRWQGKSRSDVLQECAQFSLDPYYESPELVSFSLNFLAGGNIDSCLRNDRQFATTDRRAFYSITRSRSAGSHSAPVTPGYASFPTVRKNQTDILTETAEEATPESTPGPVYAPTCEPRSTIDSWKKEAKSYFIGSPSKKITAPSLQENANELSSSQTSKILVNKLSQLQQDRGGDAQIQAKSKASPAFELCRSRKVSVYDDKSVESCRTDFSTSVSIEAIEEEEDDSKLEVDQSEQESEGLGVPSHSSWNELLKTVNTKRLRFLSQCGPPPDISSLSGSVSASPTSPSKSPAAYVDKLYKSSSSPNLGESLKKSPIVQSAPSVVRSPTRLPVESLEISTQTEDVAVVDPYEQLVMSLIRIPNELKQDQLKLPVEPTPQELADMVLQNEMNNEYSPSSMESSKLDPHSRLSYRQHLRCLYSLLKLEHFKRQTFSDRNKRLLSKISEAFNLAEKYKATASQAEFLDTENKGLKRKIFELEEKNHRQERILKEMIPTSQMMKIESERDVIQKQKEGAEELCKNLQELKMGLDNRIEQTEGQFCEITRQLKSQMKHQANNKILRKRIETLNKQVMVLGELAFHINNRLTVHRNPEEQPINIEMETYREELNRDAQFLEKRNKEYENDFISAHCHIIQLKRDIEDQNQHIQDKQKLMEDSEASWKERFAMLQKRIVELSCIVGELDVSNSNVHLVASKPIDVPGAKPSPYVEAAFSQGRLPYDE